jgi:dCMP deaminase
MLTFGTNVDYKWHVRYLRLAREISTWSKDPSRQIGAVAVSDTGQVLSTGYNGFPRGILDSKERYTDRQTKYKFVVHAEMNCIYNATFNGVNLADSTLYVYGLPMCSECGKGVIQVGIKSVYWTASDKVPEHWLESVKFTESMFKEARIKIENISSKDVL